MTACVIFSPSLASASALSLPENHRGNFRRAEALLLAAHLHLDVRVAVRGLHDFVGNTLKLILDFRDLRPMKRLTEKTVFCGLVTA